jgi:hypothetical protein
MAERKNNSGALFVNNKRAQETHPHLKGSALIDGTEYWLSAWRRTLEDGQVMISLSFAAKSPEGASIQESSPKANPDDLLDFLNSME